MGCGKEFELHIKCKRKSLECLKEWSYLIFILKDCSSYLGTCEEAEMRPVPAGREQSGRKRAKCTIDFGGRSSRGS